MIAPWQLEGNTARLIAAAWNALIDLARPEQGITLCLSGADQTMLPLQMLGVAFGDRQPAEPAQIDAYVRCSDLVVTYDESTRQHLRTQIYWRSIPASEFAAGFAEHIIAAFDLILSSNTSLLDSDPQSSVRSLVCSAGQVLHLKQFDTSGLRAQQIAPLSTAGNSGRGVTVTPTNNNTGCFITRLESVPFSYVEMVHPADFCRSTVTFANALQTGASDAVIQHHLFQRRLEKGVILRARVRSALVARQQDEAAAQAAYQHFAAAEPPLTA
jgi:hypothetical protein